MTTDGTNIPWTRYVAIGDSFSEGLCDGEYPNAFRGWADRLAGHLDERSRAQGGPGLAYANLAVRGRLLRPILDEQFDAALELKPDLVSLVGGGNDILRPSASIDALSIQIERAVVALRRRGIDVLLCTGMDPKDSPLISRTRTRIGVFNTNLWSIARRHGAYVVDLWGMNSLRDLRLWAPDRIHLTPDGHERVAQGALVALGLLPDDEAWDNPLPPLAPERPAERLQGNAEWIRLHAFPWATRRLRRRSSGDEKVAKRHEMAPVRLG